MKPAAALSAFLSNPRPTIADCLQVFEPLAAGEFSDIQIAALLTYIRTRGETPEDLLGAAQAFLAAARPFPRTGAGLMDTAGTGGDDKNTFNITTAASLLAAAGGIAMVKHGNRSVSSKSGSADVLEALGIPVTATEAESLEQLETKNFCFLFAPNYNPAVRHVQAVRRELAVPTLFNTLGPILSPGRPQFQLMGIANPAQGEIIAQAFKELGRRRALVVHGDGSDEVAITGTTLVWELRDGEITHYELEPVDFGVERYSYADLAGGTGAENADTIRAVFAGTSPAAHRAAVTASAGAMFYLHGTVDSILAGTRHAEELIDNGTVMKWLEGWA